LKPPYQSLVSELFHAINTAFRFNALREVDKDTNVGGAFKK